MVKDIKVFQGLDKIQMPSNLIKKKYNLLFFQIIANAYAIEMIIDTSPSLLVTTKPLKIGFFLNIIKSNFVVLQLD